MVFRSQQVNQETQSSVITAPAPQTTLRVPPPVVEKAADAFSILVRKTKAQLFKVEQLHQAQKLVSGPLPASVSWLSNERLSYQCEVRM